MPTVAYLTHIQSELTRLTEAVSDAEAEALIAQLLDARSIYVAGAGRSGLMARSFAMRLVHLGLCAYVVGEAVTPALREGDLLLIATGSGETRSLIPIAQRAHSLQADVAAITTAPHSTIGSLAGTTVVLPGASKEQLDSPSIQPMGSLFEQALLLFLDAVVLRIMELRSVHAQDMMSRHANLE
ncbi:6-phospho-3-hexuloisomerase [Paenibacillus sp. YYML68]|uniref:6-phospho-3-hexuloisomerase n=1 Tax=Paenibacillus sp. YYML68 TaxID=2909250 RepID=UPI002490FA03|nr:6-phospho-3-hexuloisomerase [Paenibacillus sp. YYML68]